LSETTSAGALSLSSSSLYDKAGRIIERTDAADLTTTYAYTNGGRITTVTRPVGATEVTDHYLDGRVKSMSGTGVVARFYDYGVNTDGTQWTVVYTGPAGTGSPMWVKTTTDLLGQTIREERPSYGGSIITTGLFYTNQGQLVRTETPGQADTLYDYDSLGNLIRSGLDLDDNGTLDAGTDRFSTSSSSFQKDGDDWWQVSESGVPGETTVSKTRLTGLGTSGTAGMLTAESVSLDVHSNQTISRTYTDRVAKTVTRVTDDPHSTQDAESVTVNGLLTSSTTSTGLTYTYGYDTLERQTAVTDPRIETSTTHYNTKGQVDWTEDAATNRTSFTYDPDTGRRIAVTEATGTSVVRTVLYQYDLKGQLEKVYGDTEPVDYGYDDYGRKYTMTTYRDGTSDTTTWVSEEATGLLLEKVYADGNKTTYTYTPEGQLLTRTWARGVATIYTHDPASGDLTLIDYSDSTPDVTFRDYDTQGRPHTITDGLGTRTLSYATGGFLSGDSFTGVSYTYNNGRVSDLSLGSYHVTYGYDAATGRFETVTYQPGMPEAQTFTYSYVPDSDLLHQLSVTLSGVEGLVTRTYEPNRDVLTQVKNQFGIDIISQYDYQNDELARREYLTTSGLAFEPPVPPTVSPHETTYITNELNQYTSIQEPGTSIQLVYDLDGNLTNDETFQYEYDAENRLISATPLNPQDGDKKTEYAYDYMSRRVQKKVYSYTSGSWLLTSECSFLYDGWNLIKEQTTAGGNTTTEYYVWGLDLSGTLQGAGGIGGLLAKTNSLTAKTYLYTFDANGNVGQLMDSSTGTIVAHYEYDPFGNLLVATGPEAANNPFRFSTKYDDAEVGLYYYGYRYYSPKLGRWMNRDPIGEKGGLNLYGFVKNNPITYYDPKGLNANNWTFGEIESWAITDYETLASPAGLADAKTSIAAACTLNGGRCNNVDGSAFADDPIRTAAWNNIVNATGGADLTGGGSYFCVGHPTQGCPYVTRCKTCCNGREMWVDRASPLTTTGTATVSGMGGGTLYFYTDPYDWWCNEDVYNAGGCPGSN
jgi:RHS repeat-associated protein